MAPLIWLIIRTILAILVFLILGGYYFKRYFAWELEKRRGMNYYGRSLSDRRAFKRAIKRNAFLLSPIIHIESRLQKKNSAPRIASMAYSGVQGPSFSCSEESFRKACTYDPDENDIFVVTQMRCGTTWMQQVVFQILTKGQGDFSEDGYGNLYAISPWIEGLDSVSLEKAPLLGATRRRIIKTHLPADLCPHNPKARYIYVSRHPVSCFASIIDYFHLTAGPFALTAAEILDWYCSDRMWWRPWPDHVAGWWERAQQSENVLFIPFETMKADPESAVRAVAQFLDEDTTGGTVDRVVAKSSFRFMQKHEEYFEMIPPNLFSISGAYLKSGSIDRHKNVPDEIKADIRQFCRQKLLGETFPIARFYPDILDSPDPGGV